MRMKVAQVVEGIFEAMPMVDRRRYLTEKMVREYPSKINWVEAMSNQSHCHLDFHLVYREYEQNLYRESKDDKTVTVTIAELTLVEDDESICDTITPNSDKLKQKLNSMYGIPMKEGE